MEALRASVLWRPNGIFTPPCPPGPGGQFLAAYRDQVRRLIETAGATINGSGLSGTETDTVDFSYDYDWRGNAGIVRVYSFGGTNGDVQIISLCYEHR